MSWGIVATLTGLTQNYGGLIACRLLLGLAECPMFPAAVVYMTFFYSRKELAVRFGYLSASGAVAGAVGGLLAYAIGYMDGTRGLRSWRWYDPQCWTVSRRVNLYHYVNGVVGSSLSKVYRPFALGCLAGSFLPTLRKQHGTFPTLNVRSLKDDAH